MDGAKYGNGQQCPPIQILDLTRGDKQLRRQILCAHLPPLVETYWEREHALVAAGWDSFTPSLRIQETCCDAEAVAVHRRWRVEMYMQNLSEGRFSSAFLEDISQFVKSKKEANLWDELDCLCEYKLRRMSSRQTYGYPPAFVPFFNEQIRLRNQELERHAARLVLHQAFDPSDRRSPAKLCQAVIDEVTGPWGFTQDKMNDDLRYVKQLSPSWQITLFIDTEPLDEEPYPGQITPVGKYDPRPSLQLMLGMPFSNSNWSLAAITRRCSDFFPVAERPFSGFTSILPEEICVTWSWCYVFIWTCMP